MCRRDDGSVESANLRKDRPKLDASFVLQNKVHSKEQKIMDGLTLFVLYIFPKYFLAIIIQWNQLKQDIYLLNVIIGAVICAKKKIMLQKQPTEPVCIATN